MDPPFRFRHHNSLYCLSPIPVLIPASCLNPILAVEIWDYWWFPMSVIREHCCRQTYKISGPLRSSMDPFQRVPQCIRFPLLPFAFPCLLLILVSP
ncbi:hypothetical protein BDZ91DRAFT_467197 [Kalaharituber pfeilii]|nr:hypothetical protein BDZ91DRAFT_467197 [Kalaharituber pfeilii]